jgi:hypothetical protein
MSKSPLPVVEHEAAWMTAQEGNGERGRHQPLIDVGVRLEFSNMRDSHDAVSMSRLTVELSGAHADV